MCVPWGPLHSHEMRNQIMPCTSNQNARLREGRGSTHDRKAPSSNLRRPASLAFRKGPEWRRSTRLASRQHRDDITLVHASHVFHALVHG